MLNESFDNGATFTPQTYDGAILLTFPMGINGFVLNGARINLNNANGTTQTLQFSKIAQGSGNTTCNILGSGVTSPMTFDSSSRTMNTSFTENYNSSNACNYKATLTLTAKANLSPDNFQADFVQPIDKNFVIYHNDQVIDTNGVLNVVLGPGDGLSTPTGVTVAIRNGCGNGQVVQPGSYVVIGDRITTSTCVSDEFRLRRGQAQYYHFYNGGVSDPAARDASGDGQIVTLDGTVTPAGANVMVTVSDAIGVSRPSNTTANLNSIGTAPVTGQATLASRLGGAPIILTSQSPTGTISSPTPTLFGAVLPSSRSVQVGSTATAFALINNSGASAATGCKIVPPATLAASFSYQTTDPATNALTGSPNTPVDIPVGTYKTFVFALTPSVRAAPNDILLSLSCGNSAPATVSIGINTLLFTASDTPVPDAIAVGLTPSNDGFARTGGVGGTGLFVIASANIGATGVLTARLRLSDSTMPLQGTVCQTNPQTSQCLAPPAATATATIAQNQNTTWAAFLTATNTIPALPAANRVYFEFIDGNGIVRGSTSTAVTTQ